MAAPSSPPSPHPSASGPAVRIVLVGTTHPGNIGASARAMKAMGLDALHLVAPRHFPSAEATARAAGADDVLTRAVVHASLGDALDGCGLAYGTTARERHIDWPTLTPRAAAREIFDAEPQAEIALVFGREQAGLSNDELDRCQRAIWIPTVEGFCSLNLAQAVQICAYELHLCRLAQSDPGAGARTADRVGRGDRQAAAAEVERLADHYLAVMTRVGYHDPAHPKLLERRLRRWLNRIRLLHSEVQILRGFLSAVDARLRSGSGGTE